MEKTRKTIISTRPAGRAVSVAIPFLLACTTMASVTLTDQGAEVTLDNGIVTATIDKNDAKLQSLKHNGTELMGNGGHGYLQVVLNHQYSSPDTVSFEIAHQDESMVDLSQKWVIDGLGFDFHYVMRDGDSGLYSYMVLNHHPEPASKLEIEQISYCLRTDWKMFDRIHIENDRIFDMPTPADISAGKILMPPEAVLLENGGVEHKYRYSNFAKDMDVYGWTGDHKGHWIISPSNEFMNGGPTNQELTVHPSTKSPVSLRVFHAAHYGSGTTHLDSTDGTWSKIYGPWMIYINEGGRESMWVDAKEKAAREKKAWPYDWLKTSIYPLAETRSTVQGRLTITDGSKVKGATIILAQPSDGDSDTNWQRQGKNYWFSAEADQDGSFKIEQVRPGSYTLYAFVPGVLDEFRQDGIKIAPGGEMDLGTLSWKPIKHGKLIWQIGIPDRSAGEFRHGNEYRQWGLWREYPDDFPNGVNYTIGKSKEADDWNYNQWCVQDGTDQNGRPTYRSSPWTIRFDLPGPVGEKAFLTIGIASARRAALSVMANGTRIFEGNPEDSGAAHREGIQGFHQNILIEFDASILHAEQTNEIVLEQLKEGIFESIMYDCLRLEIAP